METNLKLENGYAVLRVSGDLRLWDRRGAEQELLKLLPDDAALPGNRLLLNLADLTHIDSLGISALVRVVIACVKKSVGVGTILPGGTAGHSIRSTRIFAAWPEFDSEAAAVNQFGQHGVS
jgi:anti-anti-sigma regulatory factor